MRYKLIAAAIALAAAGYSAFWFYAAAGIEAGVREWIADSDAHGYLVAGQPEITGFPLRIVIDLETPAISAPLLAPGWTWSASRMRAVLVPWDPRHTIVVLDGDHSISFAGDGGQRRRDYRINVSRGRASLTFDDAGLVRLSADLSDVLISDAVSSPVVDAEPGVIGRLRFHGRRADDPQVRGFLESDGQAKAATADIDTPLVAILAARLDDGVIPGPGGNVLGHRIEVLEVEAGFYARQVPGPAMDELVGWGADGGVVQVRHLELGWGPLKVEASGPVTIDGAGRPTAALDAFVVGHERLIDAFAGMGAIDASYAEVVKMLVGMLPQSGPEGALMLPIIVKDGLLFLGPVPIVAVGGLPAPAAAAP